MKRRLGSLLLLGLALLAASIAVAVSASASPASIQVNTTADHDDGKCDADCTLREAIAHSSAGDVVSVPAGTYTLQLGPLTPSHELTVNGAGETVVALDGANASRVVEVPKGVGLTLTGVTIQHGQGPPLGGPESAVGGGIRVVGSLTLRNSTVTENHAADGAGLGTDDPAASATLDHVSVTGNGSPGVGGGGGIDQDKGGSLIIDASTISDNRALDGAGIFTAAQKATDKLTITDSTISDNTASDIKWGATGGGIWCNCGPIDFKIARTNVTGNTGNIGGGLAVSGIPVLNVTDSTFSGNHAKAVKDGGTTGGFCSACENGSGGAFLEDGGGQYHFDRSTLSGNTADLHGGATYSLGGPTDFTISNSTITGNTAGGGGSALRLDGTGQMTVSNSTIAANSSVGTSDAARGQIGLCDSDSFSSLPSCTPKITFTNTIVSAGTPANCVARTGATIDSGGGNIDSGTSCGFKGGDKSSTDPHLGPLASNGGLTDTMALQSGSPAIDAAVGCPPPATDQRGAQRVGACDIGAYEKTNDAGTSSIAFTASAYTVERSAGSKTVTVHRTGELGRPVAVDWSVDAGTTIEAASGRVTFDAGQADASFDVTIPASAVPQGETTYVNLQNPSEGAVLGSPSTAKLTVTDGDAVDTTIEDGPRGWVRTTSPEITFEAQPPDGATFECKVDSHPYESCTSPWHPSYTLTDGSHVYTVRAHRGSAVDPTPDTWEAQIDTAKPKASIDVCCSSARVSDGWAGAALIEGKGTDPSPGSGVRHVRCVVDPTGTPAGYDAMPDGDCSVSITKPGTHRVYAAAIDWAGNRGPMVTRNVKVIAQPDTFIDSGPTGSTWRRDPTFTFRSTLPFGTFRCRFDFNDFKDCDTPYAAPPLRPGQHTLVVEAVNEGVEDPTPATRTFTVREPVSVTKGCEVTPFEAPHGNSQIGCGLGPGCPDRVGCAKDLAPCPLTAVCTLTMSVTFDTPEDRFTRRPAFGDFATVWGGTWTVTPYLGFMRSVGCEVGVWEQYGIGGGGRPDGRTHCQNTSSVRFFGQNRKIPSYCYVRASTVDDVLKPVPGDTGPDDQRRLHCQVTLLKESSTALEAAAAGEQIQIYAPVPGIAGVPGDLPPKRSGKISAAKRVRAFKTVRRRVKHAGPITFKPRLTKVAKRRLKRTGSLRIRLHVTFKPTHGKKTTRTSTVVLRKPKSTKARNRAALRRYCRKHKKLRKTRACRGV